MFIPIVPTTPSLIHFTLSALHYPYVLAFEPTFVEIRNVETGSMSQIIQGNDLRCLFADTPPSAIHAGAGRVNSVGSISTGGYGQQSVYNPYAAPGIVGHHPYAQASYGGVMRGGAPGMYAQQTMPGQVPVYMGQHGMGQHGMPSPVPSQSSSRMSHQASGRDEIIMASGDRIMTLRMVQPG